MSEFIQFKNAVSLQLSIMETTGLFTVNLDKDELWDTYLKSFPEGTNPIYRERTEHDCQCCKQFIRKVGNVITIIDGIVVSIWDVVSEHEHYQVVADAMSKFVKSHAIENKFLHYERNVGTDKNFEDMGDHVHEWNHFYHMLGRKYVVDEKHIDSKLGSERTAVQTFKRALDTITGSSVEMVLELIEQNSLYRGNEYKNTVEEFGRHRIKYKYLSEKKKNLYVWLKDVHPSVSGIRNSAIGTLLVDLSEGKDLNYAVESFEKKVAPENYKRSSAPITQSMIKKAKEKVDELGISDALPRRYAHIDDLTINNVIFADRDSKRSMNVFDQLETEVSIDPKKYDKVEDVSIDTFVNDILPKADSIELMVENKHVNNLVSLIAPVNDDAPNILKWDNNFSWSYNGEVTDSIKEKVKAAGGMIDADLRCSLSWYNRDDLDIHAIEPNGNKIYYGRKDSRYTGGKLDVDMNVHGETRTPVENIVWKDKRKMLEGRYQIIVHNYTSREQIDVGFEVEIEYQGSITNYVYGKKVPAHRKVTVAEFDFSYDNGIKFVKTIESTQTAKNVWNIKTQQFHPVSTVMLSPNHWDGQQIGNKHWFFMIHGCKNDEQSRGLYNEFLRGDLTEHRKVFEMLGSKLKTEVSDNQLSGLGFSSTKRDSVLCKVTGSFSRTVKINF